MQDLAQSMLLQLPRALMLVVEQRQLGRKADVGEREVVADQCARAPGQRALDSRRINRKCLLRPAVDRISDGAIQQRKEINLRVAREDQARIQETIDPRCFVGITSIEREL